MASHGALRSRHSFYWHHIAPKLKAQYGIGYARPPSKRGPPWCVFSRLAASCARSVAPKPCARGADRGACHAIASYDFPAATATVWHGRRRTPRPLVRRRMLGICPQWSGGGSGYRGQRWAATGACPAPVFGPEACPRPFRVHGGSVMEAATDLSSPPAPASSAYAARRGRPGASFVSGTISCHLQRGTEGNRGGR